MGKSLPRMTVIHKQDQVDTYFVGVYQLKSFGGWGKEANAENIYLEELENKTFQMLRSFIKRNDRAGKCLSWIFIGIPTPPIRSAFFNAKEKSSSLSCRRKSPRKFLWYSQPVISFESWEGSRKMSRLIMMKKPKAEKLANLFLLVTMENNVRIAWRIEKLLCDVRWDVGCGWKTR